MKALGERASVGGTFLLALSLCATLAPACSGGGDEDGGAGEAGASGSGGREGSGGGAGGGPAPDDGSLLVYADAVGFLVRYPVLMKVTPDGELDTTFGQEGLVAFPVAMPLLAGASGQPAKRLAASGNLAWFVDEGVFEDGNRGFLIRVELDRL